MATDRVRHAIAAGFILAPALLPAMAHADGVRNTTCLSAGGAFSCTTQWHYGTGSQFLPWKVDPRDVAASAERERKWLARCRPVAREDGLGIRRYVYAAAGCEFGKIED